MSGLVLVTIAGLILYCIKLKKLLKKTKDEAGVLNARNTELQNENQELRKVIMQHSDHQWHVIETLDKLIEIEQERIAHELHDDTIQRLVAIRFRIEQLDYFDLSPRVKKETDEIRHELENIMGDIRFLIKGITLAQFKEHTFSELMRKFYEKVRPLFIKKISLEILQEENEFDLRADVKQELHRIVQEAVQNSLKYSVGFQLNIRVTWSDILLLQIWDNGIGRWQNPSGTGSSSMNKRAVRIGAKLKVMEDGRGLHIDVELPSPTN